MSGKGSLSPSVILCLTALLASGCGGDQDAGAAATCPETEAVPDSKLSKLPEDLPLDKWGTVTEISLRGGYVGATAVTEAKIVELYPKLSRHIMKNGFVTVSGDNEGFEAEIFFQKGKATGSFLLREGPCDGEVTIKLLFKLKRAGKQ